MFMAEYQGDRVGQQLGSYRLTRLLGKGGFGEVYEADHQLLEQKRAIKLLRESHFYDPDQHERFLREARTLATLDHRNILPLLEVGKEGDVLYLVMPFYRRGTLHDFLKQRTTPLSLPEVECFLEQICAAVGYAHTRNIAHLDLKPQNILLHDDGRLIISDFGLAHIVQQGQLMGGSSLGAGTPQYMAPEHIQGKPGLQSDLYALGIILYQLLTNPFPLISTLPARLESVVRNALERKIEDRYATAEALLADFQAAASDLLLSSAQSFGSAIPSIASLPHLNSSTPPGRTQHTNEPADGMRGTIAGCEIVLKSGHNCGVAAIGRCSTCGRAFCPTHQAWNQQTFYIDRCAPCLAEEQANAVEQQRKAQAKVNEAWAYFRSGSARRDLLTSGVPPVDIYQIASRLEVKGSLRQRYERAEKGVISTGHGWILGEFEWYSLQENFTGRAIPVLGNCLTALLDATPDAPWFRKHADYFNNNCTLARVRPYRGGYAVFHLRENDRFRGNGWWIEAARAVKRLTGASR